MADRTTNDSHPRAPRLLRHAASTRASLAANADHQHAARHALVHYASGTVCSFIPKNACSTLRVSLAIANGCIAGPEDWTWIHDNNRTFSATLAELAVAPYTFVVLRCPHARLASAFLDKIVGRSADYWTLFRQTGDTLHHDTLTFRSFVACLRDRRNLLCNAHWRPQRDFLVYEDYDDWFRLEDFAWVPARLQVRAGLRLVDARPLTQHGTDRLALDDTGPHADTPAPEIEAMLQAGRAPSHRAFYDAPLAAAVGQLYAGDVAIYRARFGDAGLMFAPATGA